jgi:Tfp pilus assembly protein PilZ
MAGRCERAERAELFDSAADREDRLPPESELQKLRIPFVRKAGLTIGGAEQEAFVLDLGLKGVFVEHEEPLPVGAEVLLRLPLPGREIPLTATCRLAWWKPAEKSLETKSLPAGVGLEFQDISEADQAHVRGLLEEYCRQDPQARHFLRHWPDTKRLGDDP